MYEIVAIGGPVDIVALPSGVDVIVSDQEYTDVVLAPEGPVGRQGAPGTPGQDGDGVIEVGDLTLIFDNHLI